MEDKFLNYYYKLDICGNLKESNLIYTPTVNNSCNKMCMHFCIDYYYRNNQCADIDDQLLDYFFRQELKNLQDLQEKDYVPTLFDYDTDQKKLIIEWNKYTLSDMMFNGSGFCLSKKHENEISYIVEDLLKSGYWKMALYPHCFFIDESDNIKTIDFYSAVTFNNRFIKRNFIEKIIGKQGAYRFDLATHNGVLDLKKFFFLNINEHLPKYWPNQLIQKIKEVLDDYRS